MVDWAKKRTWKERILVDFGLHKQKKLVSKWNLAKLTKKLTHSEISLKNDVEPHLTVTCIGNAPLPTAYRWTPADTRENLIQPTFARIEYHLLSGLFPSFTFSAHTVLHYNWIAKDYPELFASIQAFQRDDAWEITGGTWANHNWSIISGNSILHQLLLGQRFNAKSFQQITSIGWVDNVEAVPANMPQFLQKSGITALYCSSDSPSSLDGDEIFPFLHWMWQAPDGTRIPVSRSTKSGDFFSHLPHFSRFSRGLSPDSSSHLFSYATLQNDTDKLFSQESIPLMASPYGVSGKTFGLSSDVIMEKSLWEEAGFVTLGTVKSYFAKLARYEIKLPTWTDAVFLRSAGFDLTFAGATKENNRTAEVLISQTEALSVISGLLGGDHYQDELTRDWETLLMYQDAYIISGNTILEMYRRSIQNYQSIFAHLGSCQENSLMQSAHLQKTDVKNDTYTIFNGLGWDRGGYATILRRNYNQTRSSANTLLIVQAVSFTPYVANRESHLGIQIPAGSDLLFAPTPSNREDLSQSSQKTASKPAFDGDDIFEMEIDVPLFNAPPQIKDPIDRQGLSSPVNPVVDPKDKLLVYIPPNESIPSFGMIPITFAKTSVPQAKPSEGFSESQTEWVFRDPSLCLKISKALGNITHFSLSPTTTNLLGPAGIGYTLYKISPSKPKLPLQVDSIEVIEKGPLRFTFLIKYRPTKARTLISTRISIYHQSRKIYGETLVDLKETNMLLALEVDTQLSPKVINCGGPFCVHRHVLPTTSKFLTQIDEVPFQEFVYWSGDLKIDSIGTVAVYFQTKFGMSISGNVPRFHLVAAKPLPRPDTTITFPDSDLKSRVNVSDQGYQRIPWAIEFLPPSVPVSTIIRHAREYNTPFFLAPTNAVHDTLSFFSMDSPNVMLVSVKEIEEFMREAPDWFYQPTMAELAFVIQCVECNGIETTCSLQIDPTISLKQAMEVDFIERISHHGIQNSDVMLSGHTVKFTIRPHEIKSIMVVGRIILEQE